jgi:hypothetical protein
MLVPGLTPTEDDFRNGRNHGNVPCLFGAGRVCLLTNLGQKHTVVTTLT